MIRQATHSHTDTACPPAGWSVERGLRLAAGIVVTGSVLLGMFVHPMWLYLTLFAGLNLLQSSFTKWCPMMTILRRAGLS